MALVTSSDALVPSSDALVTSSDALVPSSDALVPNSFLLLLQGCAPGVKLSIATSRVSGLLWLTDSDRIRPAPLSEWQSGQDVKTSIALAQNLAP